MSEPVPHQSRRAAVRDVVLGGATVAGATVLSPLLRRRGNRWGATDSEVASTMPGDDLVARPELGYTRALTIAAPPTRVWPWLAQIGQGRGGFYSYDGLENLLGCGIHSADQILADHQVLEEGDLVRSGPDNFPCWMVLDVRAPHHLTLVGAGTPAHVAAPEIVDGTAATDSTVSTWQWQLRPGADESQTRLIVRQRLVYVPGEQLVWRLVEPIHFTMERKMLMGIKSRAERPRSETSWAHPATPRGFSLDRYGAGVTREVLPLTVYGSTSSYFTGKLEAFLRYKEVPYEFVSISPDVIEKVRENTGVFQVPAVQLADGTWMTDSTPMIQWLDSEFPESPVIPVDPATRFLSLLVEDFADEWLWRPAMHYRWSFPEDRFTRGTRLGSEIFRNQRLPRAVQRKLIQQRQLGVFIRGDGVDPATKEHVDNAYTRMLVMLEPIFQSRSYLLGEHPTLVDIAFMGPMFRHFAQDPTPAHMMADRAPGVWEWVARTWNGRGSRLADRSLLDVVPGDWDPILRESGETHLEQLDANARAHLAGLKEHDLTVQGVTYRRLPTSPYRVWCLERLRAEYDGLDSDAAARVRARLETAGAWEPLWRTSGIRSGHDPSDEAPFCRGSRVIPDDLAVQAAAVHHRRWLSR